ncbi:MAG: 23S rRNA (pseudouridine(1915)-N(3))-methyltransferase RlmH [archaeon]
MITIISVGTNKMFKDQEKEYLTRINHFSKAEVLELKNDKSQNIEEVIKKEGESLLSKIKDKPFIALDPKGAQLTTVDFAHLLKKTIAPVFVIGGANGLSEDVKKRAKSTISLSSMTFTHEMARILLLEQIYRTLTIERNMKYHK